MQVILKLITKIARQVTTVPKYSQIQIQQPPQIQLSPKQFYGPPTAKCIQTQQPQTISTGNTWRNSNLGVRRLKNKMSYFKIALPPGGTCLATLVHIEIFCGCQAYIHLARCRIILVFAGIC